MSEELPRKSHGVAWALAVFIAAPVLYLLSVPPVVIIAEKIAPVFPSKSTSLPPKWAVDYAKLYGWLADNTPLKEPSRHYIGWWLDVLGEP